MFGVPQIVSCGGGGGGSGGRQGGLGQSLAGPSLCHADAQWVPARLSSGPCWGRGTQDRGARRACGQVRAVPCGPLTLTLHAGLRRFILEANWEPSGGSKQGYHRWCGAFCGLRSVW